jgi:hypothetical protein
MPDTKPAPVSTYTGTALVVHRKFIVGFCQDCTLELEVTAACGASLDIVINRVIVAAVGAFFQNELCLYVLKPVCPPEQNHAENERGQPTLQRT